MPKSCASFGSSATERTIAPVRVRFSTTHNTANRISVPTSVTTSAQVNQTSPKRMLAAVSGLDESLRIAAEDLRGAAGEYIAEAQRDDHQAGEVLLHDQRQHHGLQQDAEEAERQHGERHGEVVAEAELLHDRPGNEGAQHVELAVCEVDEPGRAQQHRPADGDQRVT